MPGAAVDIGTGASVAFATSAFTAEVMSINGSGISREAIETTHLGTTVPAANEFGGRTYIPGDLADPGELTLEINFNPDTLPPIGLAKETITVSFPLVAGDATPANWAGEGFVTGMDFAVPLEDKMTATITVKLSGAQTRTLAA